MRRFLFLGLFIGIFSTLHAQELTGKWKGYFIPNNDQEGRIYIYDVDIRESENHQITANTYTNLSGSFSAKAVAKGFHSVKTQLVSIIETKFEDVNVLGNMQACLMINYLNYSNNQGRGILQGTYISSNTTGTKDCGGGKVYLEKDFVIEKWDKNSFAKNKLKDSPKELPKDKETTASKNQNNKINNSTNNSITENTITNNKNSLLKNNSSNISSSNTNSSNVGNVNIGDHSSKTIATNKLVIPKVNNNITIASSKNAINSATPTIIPATASTTPTIISKESNPAPNAIINNDSKLSTAKIEPIAEETDTRNNQNIPWVLLGRENKLIKHIVTSNKKITIDLYDNGTIDNDTINIYDNKQLISNKRRLSYKAIHIEVDFSNGVREHEIIIVAHNMGTIPPNTALFVLNDGDTRQEYFITTTDKVNAKFEFVYKPTD